MTVIYINNTDWCNHFLITILKLDFTIEVDEKTFHASYSKIWYIAIVFFEHEIWTVKKKNQLTLSKIFF